MSLGYELKQEIQRLVHLLQEKQSANGAWHFCFETGSLTDANMIILLRTLEIDNEALIQKLVERLLSRQEQHGTWKLYADEPEGSISATIEAYCALLFSGYCSADEPRMQHARQFILDKGGLAKANMYTKVMLSITGNYPWSELVSFPIELMLLPPSFPLSFFDLAGYTRVHIAPLLILADRKYSKQTSKTPELSSLLLQTSRDDIDKQKRLKQSKDGLQTLKAWLKQLAFVPEEMHQKALKQTEQFILARVESDGTLYSYASATYLMIYALIALGYSKDNSLILKAVTSLENLACHVDEQIIHVQNSTSTIWDSALCSYSLQEAGVHPSSPTIQQAGNYLLSRQHVHYGDWAIHNPHVRPGGWGFSDINTINPDIDDTTAALRAISKLEGNDAYLQAWNNGVEWVLSMQNDDGGWAAFEKNTDKKILTWLPVENAQDVAIDPSAADLTGRSLEFLGNYAHLTIAHPAIKRAVDWLLENQEEDGSWYGRWGICYLYGTWAAITGLIAIGLSPTNPAIQKAVQWLLSLQNADGGWGESCQSDLRKSYVPLRASTLSQTAWVVDALVAVHSHSTSEIEKGVMYLIAAGQKQDWSTTYPTGAGLPGGFYIHYHSYRYIFPLLALSHYRKKYGLVDP